MQFRQLQQSDRNELLPRTDLEQAGECPPDLAGRRIFSHPRQSEPTRQLRPLSKVSIAACIDTDSEINRLLEFLSCITAL